MRMRLLDCDILGPMLLTWALIFSAELTMAIMQIFKGGIIMVKNIFECELNLSKEEVIERYETAQKAYQVTKEAHAKMEIISMVFDIVDINDPEMYMKIDGIIPSVMDMYFTNVCDDLDIETLTLDIQKFRSYRQEIEYYIETAF